MGNDYVPPSFGKDAFCCPHCGVYAHQNWNMSVLIPTANGTTAKDFKFDIIKDLAICLCARCNNYTLWVKASLVYPLLSLAPMPVDDMPNDVKMDFLEARIIVGISPRASAALLRLALQKLMKDLGENAKDLNQDIGNLVKKDLPVRIQRAADALRVIGNNAVHPGQIDLKDDYATAIALFTLLNIIVESMITNPTEIDQLYRSLPENALTAIDKRDKKV